MTCKCGRAVDGTTLCQRCSRTLDVALANIPAYVADLELSAARRKAVRYDLPRGKGGTKSPPIPVDARFLPESNGAKAIAVARNAVVTWTRVCLEEFGGTHPRDTVASCCGYLQGVLSRISVAIWADELLRDMLAAERALYRVDDRRETFYVGRCSADDDDPNGPCQAELYAREGELMIQCRACGVEHDVRARREFMLDQAKDYLVTASEAAGALLRWTDYAGTERNLVDRIRKWRDREKLEVQDVTSLLGRDRHLYRLGDIQDLMIQHAQDEQARQLTVR